MKDQGRNLIKKIFFWPSKNIALTIPLALIIGFLAGLNFNTNGLKQYMLFITVIVIYPTMIGFRAKEILNLSNRKLMLTAILLNFLFVPGLAYVLGISFLLKDPQLFAGLAITSLLPTSNMTIAFTMLAKGNVPAAIKLTTSGLLLGSLLAPWYLFFMVGKYVPVDILLTLKTIAIVIILPLILGMLTYKGLMKKYTPEQFQSKIKPYLPAISPWGMILIIFISISVNAQRIISNFDIFFIAFLIQLIFYALNYLVAIFLSRMFFNQQDGLTLVFSTGLRNLSISIGLAATAFGSNAALMVSLAVLIQGQAAAWFIKLNEKHHILTKRRIPGDQIQQQ